MANLKLDLVNKLNNEKYYEELELIRLAQEPNMNYKEKIDLMSVNLENIALLNSQVELVEKYFKEPVSQAISTPITPPNAAPVIPNPQATSNPVDVPQDKVPQDKVPQDKVPASTIHQGQSHGEQ